MYTFDEMVIILNDLYNHAKIKRIKDKWAVVYSDLMLYKALYGGQMGPNSRNTCMKLINEWFKLVTK